jgi:O-antigen ligase/thioredoxin-like negative regulator of GroEL
MMVTAIFVVVVFVADVFGANPQKSFWSNYERMEGFVALIHLFGYFLVAGSVLRTEKLWTRFFHTVIFTNVIMVFYSLLQLGGAIQINQSVTRLDGTFGNSAYLAVYMLFGIAFTAFLLVRHRGSSFVKWVYGIIIFFQGLILYYTQTRGVIIGLAVGIVFSTSLILLFNKKNRRVRNIAFGILAVLVLMVSSLAVFRDSSFVKESEVLNRIASLSLTQALNNPRFMVWGMAIDGFKERPILGWGQENFNFVFNKYYDPKMYGQEQWFDRAHNIFFDWLIAGGILGLLGYLSLFFAAFATIWKNDALDSPAGETWFARFKNGLKSYFRGERGQKALEASILSGLLVAYFINNIFVFDNLFSYILFFSLLAYLHHLHSVGREPEKKNRKALEKELPFTVIGVPVAILFVAAVYFVNLRPIYANQALIEGIRPHGNTFTEENLKAFQEAVSYGALGKSEAREQVLQSAMQVKDAPVEQGLKDKMFALAKEQILLQIQDAPGDARYEMFAGILFSRYGMNVESIAHFEQAHKFSPKKQTIGFDLILGYLNTNRIDEAYNLAKEAYDSAPEFQEAAKFYAITAMYKGDEQLANDLLVKTFGSELYYDETLINVYAQLKRFDKVVTVLQNKLSGGADDPQLRLRLAAAYLEVGKKNESLAEIQGIIDAHPDFKAQGEFYMNQIKAGKKP